MIYPSKPPPLWSSQTKPAIGLMTFSIIPILCSVFELAAPTEGMPTIIHAAFIWVGMFGGLFPWFFFHKINRKAYCSLVIGYSLGPTLFTFLILLCLSSAYNEHRDATVIFKVITTTVSVGTLYFAFRIIRARKHLKETTEALLVGRVVEDRGALYYLELSGKTGKGRYTLEPCWVITILSIIVSTIAASLSDQNLSSPGLFSHELIDILFIPSFILGMMTSGCTYFYYEFLVFRELERITNRPIYFEDALPNRIRPSEP